MDTDNNDLLLRLKAGDSLAWSEAFRTLYPRALAAAKQPHLGIEQGDAEDLAVEAIEQIFPHIGQVKKFDELYGLVCTIAYRRSISRLRRKLAAKRSCNKTTSFEDMKTEFVETTYSVFENFDGLQSKELLGLLTKAMSQLDNRIRLLLEDHLIQNLTYREIAEKHSMPIGSVGVSLSRGLKKVREHIDSEPVLKEHLQHYLERLRSEV